ncbi:MAG: hypothetical protein Q8R79_04815 [Legionellaceae bacterium]|nr:hypothetical protein [Legionellaceae bacterium]
MSSHLLATQRIDVVQAKKIAQHLQALNSFTFNSIVTEPNLSYFQKGLGILKATIEKKEINIEGKKQAIEENPVETTEPVAVISSATTPEVTSPTADIVSTKSTPTNEAMAAAPPPIVVPVPLTATVKTTALEEILQNAYTALKEISKPNFSELHQKKSEKTEKLSPILRSDYLKKALELAENLKLDTISNDEASKVAEVLDILKKFEFLTFLQNPTNQEMMVKGLRGSVNSFIDGLTPLLFVQDGSEKVSFLKWMGKQGEAIATEHVSNPQTISESKEKIMPTIKEAIAQINQSLEAVNKAIFTPSESYKSRVDLLQKTLTQIQSATFNEVTPEEVETFNQQFAQIKNFEFTALPVSEPYNQSIVDSLKAQVTSIVSALEAKMAAVVIKSKEVVVEDVPAEITSGASQDDPNDPNLSEIKQEEEAPLPPEEATKQGETSQAIGSTSSAVPSPVPVTAPPTGNRLTRGLSAIGRLIMSIPDRIGNFFKAIGSFLTQITGGSKSKPGGSPTPTTPVEEGSPSDQQKEKKEEEDVLSSTSSISAGLPLDQSSLSAVDPASDTSATPGNTESSVVQNLTEGEAHSSNKDDSVGGPPLV